ncbi:MAG: replication restart helicase PriA, partial [Fibrobacterota bacterium]
LAQKALKQQKGVIILVPEISLTPQTIQRFRDAMGDVIAVIHSRMSDGERRDSVEEIVSGKKRVVIGVRSAIMAPMNNIGLIIVDEEHDSSYKQEDLEPRYHARDTAVMRGQFQNAVVVLGSATPSFETYFNAQSGKYELIRLQNRFGNAILPHVKIIDMNKEHRDNNWTFLSRYLRDRIADTVLQKRQVILLLNRRGFSVSLMCKRCSHTYECPDCSVKLTYHKTGTTLKCHQCGFSRQAPDVCPKCKGEQIKYQGTGIQKAEEMLKEVFPMARILRMDQDTTRRKGAHVKLLSSFEREEADILLGTQMVAKGLDFPNVKLVGVLQADIGLHIPDFRSSERTFQLLAQVAGRAGRLDNSGEVVIQTYQPEDSCIVYSQTHDYTGFFHLEIQTRKTLRYPPFGRLARILIEAEKLNDAVRFSESIAQMIKVDGGRKVELLGPSPAPLARLRNAHRYSMLLRSSSVQSIQKICRKVQKEYSRLPAKVKMIIIIDPLNML